jgi:uroporphyrinogen-III decarboxylase
MDICEVVWGSTIFYAMYDQTELVHALLEIVTQTYVRFMNAWLEVVPFEKHGNAHWGFFHQGNIMLRDDSAMNLSPDMFDEFVRPYDQRLLDEFGGGAIHFCGKGDHYIDRLPQMKGVCAVHMSQPEYNDMEKMLAHTARAGINLIGLEPGAAKKAMASGMDFCGRVQSYLN